MKIRDLFKENVLTFSNLLTVIRLASIPFIVIYMHLEKTTSNSNLIVNQLLFFIIIIITDFFDGLIARKFNQVSKLGQFLDPLTDKICLITIGSSLIYYKDFPLWILLTIIAREIFVVFAALLLFYKRDVEVKPNIFGKLGIAFMSFTTIFYIINFNYYFCGVNLKEFSAIISLIFYITGSILYVKKYAAYYSVKKNI